MIFSRRSTCPLLCISLLHLDNAVEPYLRAATSRAGALGKSPRFGADDLSLTVCPEVYHESNHVVDGRVGGLVEESSGETGEREHDEAELEAAMDEGAGDEGSWPVENEHEDAQEEVDDLKGGDGLDGTVERLGGEVPKDLGPDEALDGSADLVGRRGHDDETSPVVLDKTAHFVGLW